MKDRKRRKRMVDKKKREKELGRRAEVNGSESVWLKKKAKFANER